MRRELIIIMFLIISFSVTSELVYSTPGPCEYNGVETINKVPQGSEYEDEEFIVIDNEWIVNNLSQISGLTCLQYIDYRETLSGDIAGFSNLTDMKVINLNENPDLYGDICALNNLTNLIDLRMAFDQKIYGDISCLSNLNLRTFAMTDTRISGDLSDLSHMTNLEALYLSGTNVKGDISSLAALTNLEELNIQDSEVTGSEVYGDLSSLNNLKNLRKVALYNLQVTGCDEFMTNHPDIEGGCSSTNSVTVEEQKKDKGTPGFETVFVLLATSLFLFLRRKNKF